MRDLLRTRKQLVHERASRVQRIQKPLEDANLKLASVLTDIMGRSGRTRARRARRRRDRSGAADGARRTPDQGGSRGDRRRPGRLGRHHRFLLGLHLGQIDALAAAIASIDAEVDPGRERRKAPLDPADKDSA
jgi:hypothetical protein